MPAFGAIYIAHNPRDGSNVFKVGLTERSVPERMAELTASTSNLGTYEAVGYLVVTDVQEAEKKCHERLSYCRVQDNREFFEERLDTIVRIVRESCRPFEVRDYFPEKNVEEPLDIKNIVSKSLKKGDKERNSENETHSKVLKSIREHVTQVLPRLSDLKDNLPNDNLKFVLYNPKDVLAAFAERAASIDYTLPEFSDKLDFKRLLTRTEYSTTTAIKLADVIFFGKLVKTPIKISDFKNNSSFLQLSRTVQEPQAHPSEHWRDSSYAFDDDGRWLRISGSIICGWAKPKNKNDGYFLYSDAFELEVVEIGCKEIGGDVEAASYTERWGDRKKSVRLLSDQDFLRVFATVCADNAKLCPEIDRSFSFRTGRYTRYANLSESYVSQEPILESLIPYFPEVKSQR